MALIKCPECECEISSTVAYCPHCASPLPEELRTKKCPECGAEEKFAAVSCGSCGFQFPAEEPKQTTGAAEISANISKSINTGLNKISGGEIGKSYISFGKMLKEGIRKRSRGEISSKLDELFVSGSPATTPKLGDIHPETASVWLFWYVLIFFLIALGGMQIGFYTVNNSNFLPGLIMFGAFGVPISCMVLFLEVDLFRNISLYRVIAYFLAGGVMSLLVTMVLFQIIPAGRLESLRDGLIVGLVEEAAKAFIVVLFIIREKRARFVLDGLLIGAAVGAGFAAFETAGYILRYGINYGSQVMDSVLTTRAYLAPGGHVAWAALEGGAFMMARGAAPKSTWAHAKSPKFLLPCIIPWVLHGIWDTSIPLFNDIFKDILLIVVIWVVLFYYINLGLKQAEDVRSAAVAAGSTDGTDAGGVAAGGDKKNG